MQRLLFVQACADVGGTELQAFEMAKWLRPQGFEVHTLFDCAPGEMLARYDREGLPYLVRQDGAWPSATLRAWVRDVAPRAALLHGLGINVKWRIWLRLFFPSVRRWGANRGLTNSGHVPWHRVALDRLTVPLLDGYVSNSKFIIDYLVQRGFPREKMVHIKNFVRLTIDTADRSPLVIPSVAGATHEVDLPSTVPILTYIANARPVKGHTFLLRALALLEQRGVAFTCLLVGDLWRNPRLPDEIEALGLSDVVVCAGPRTDTDQILLRSDVFVFPSLMEGCPNAVLEAMRAGLPVVASPWGDQGWLIQDGKGGYVVDPHDTDAFADRIELLLRDPDARRAFGAHNVERLQTVFAREDVERAALELFTRMTRQDFTARA